MCIITYKSIALSEDSSGNFKYKLNQKYSSPWYQNKNMKEWYLKNRVKNSRYESGFADDEQDSVSPKKASKTIQSMENDKTSLTYEFSDKGFQMKSMDIKPKAVVVSSKEVTLGIFLIFDIFILKVNQRRKMKMYPRSEQRGDRNGLQL